MWGNLIKAAVAVGGAAVAYLAADKATKHLTGKHIHQHVFSWWRRLHDTVAAWVASNPEITIVQVVGYIAEKIDDVACEMKKTMDLQVFAVGADQVHRPIVTERAIPVADIVKQYPQFQTQTAVALEDLI